ncbi:TetR/AcrR family transcriptional regulator [Nocardiopsis sp. NPDC006139]|uniref:TetR/AcrR family transcriptional regulator n=1 Tax=Nocardiopsis sp. NPDC006139 TaxID=3154578 RepID=UPI0033AE4442
MRSKNETDGQKRSFIEEARRKQIIAAAVATIAEVGFPKASLARIAATAGVSKGVISYHFAGKDELVDQVVVTVYTEIADTLLPRLAEQEKATDVVRAHVLGVAEYALAHPDRLRALTEIFVHDRGADGVPRYGAVAAEPLYESLEGLYREGQARGELREFDVRVMAVTQQSAIDAMFGYWISRPETDLLAHARELADLLVRAVRPD